MDFGQHKKSFLKKLESVDASATCAGEYATTYLQHLLKHKEYYIDIYAAVLSSILKNSTKENGALSLVDYGCGNGLLGLFARHCGFSPVVFQDTDREFLDSAKNLSTVLKVNEVYFVPGEIDQLHHLPHRIDAVAGTDVIEHIYNLDAFLQHIKELNPEMVTAFTTAANPFNPLLVARLKKLQWQDEWKGNDGSSAGLSGHRHEPFVHMRKEIISRVLPAEKNLDDLAVATRGLYGADIEIAAREFHLTNRLPVPSHPTNTCNPVTGSWTERLLSPSAYRALFNKHGFEVTFTAGFYNVHRSLAGRIPAKMLNGMVFLLGKTFSPFLIISAHKK